MKWILRSSGFIHLKVQTILTNILRSVLHFDHNISNSQMPARMQAIW